MQNLLCKNKIVTILPDDFMNSKRTFPAKVDFWTFPAQNGFDPTDLNGYVDSVFSRVVPLLCPAS
jgi:hypothetical protein